MLQSAVLYLEWLVHRGLLDKYRISVILKHQHFNLFHLLVSYDHIHFRESQNILDLPVRCDGFYFGLVVRFNFQPYCLSYLHTYHRYRCPGIRYLTDTLFSFSFLWFSSLMGISIELNVMVLVLCLGVLVFVGVKLLSMVFCIILTALCCEVLLDARFSIRQYPVGVRNSVLLIMFVLLFRTSS